MSLTHIEIGDDALATARRLGGYATKTAVVAEALREYNQRHERAAAYDRSFELAQHWDLAAGEPQHQADKEQYVGRSSGT